LTLNHRQLLREPLHLPSHLIRVVAVDPGGVGREPEARFPVFDDSAFASHAVRSSTPRGWIWPVGRGRIPLFGLMRDVPNVLIVLNDAVPGPRVRKEKLHGPLNGESFKALAVRVQEPATLAPALRAHGLLRDLSLADAATL
jgi:hypothetical protein